MCHRARGVGPCDCCPACGDHRFRLVERTCLTCHPPSTEAPAPIKKQPVAKLDAKGRLLSVKPNSRSRAPDAIRREQLYAQATGKYIGGSDDDFHA